MTMVPILKTKVAKNNVEVNKTKEVKNWFGALGRQDHEECQAERSLVKEPLNQEG